MKSAELLGKTVAGFLVFLLAVVLAVINPIIGALIGAAAGFIVDSLLGTPIIEFTTQGSVFSISLWQIGIILGFVLGFFKGFIKINNKPKVITNKNPKTPL